LWLLLRMPVLVEPDLVSLTDNGRNNVPALSHTCPPSHHCCVVFMCLVLCRDAISDLSQTLSVSAEIPCSQPNWSPASGFDDELNGVLTVKETIVFRKIGRKMEKGRGKQLKAAETTRSAAIGRIAPVFSRGWLAPAKAYCHWPVGAGRSGRLPRCIRWPCRRFPRSIQASFPAPASGRLRLRVV